MLRSIFFRSLTLALTILTCAALPAAQPGAGAKVIFEAGDSETMALFQSGGWTLLTAVNLMLFSLLHNPCSTTIYTIYTETGSKKWTALAALLPLAMGVMVTFSVAQIWRLFSLF